jgi:hypothetical protein
MEDTQTPVISRELATKDEALPVRAEPPITVIERRRGPHPALFLALGVLIGVGGTALAFNQRTQRPVTVARAGETSGKAPALVVPRVGAQSLNPNGPADPVPGTVGALVAQQKVQEQPEEIPQKPAGNTPMDPFADGMVLPSLPLPSGGGKNPFQGMILPERLPSLPRVDPGPRKPNPLDEIVKNGIPKPPPVLKIQPPTDKELAPSHANFQPKADNLIAYAGTLGGKAHTLKEKSVATGVQATVPDKALPDLLKHAAGLGATVLDKSSWNGDTSERSQRFVQEAESKLASLKKYREALLVTYLEDSQPVKDVDADIAEAQKALDEAKTSKPAVEKMTVVRFSFVK